MATVRKTITLTDQQDHCVKAQIEAIHSALIEGENSGPAQVFDARAFKQKLRTQIADCSHKPPAQGGPRGA